MGSGPSAGLPGRPRWRQIAAAAALLEKASRAAEAAGRGRRKLRKDRRAAARPEAARPPPACRAPPAGHAGCRSAGAQAGQDDDGQGEAPIAR